MLRGLTLAALLATVPGVASAQALSVLHIKVTLTDAAQASMPVPRHALLISDDPPTAVPRRVVTGPDGTTDVRLRPGSYTIESDEPVTFDGKSYQWTQTVAIAAGRDTVLDLTAKNAEVGAPAPSSSSSSAAGRENDPSLLLPKWKDSVVAVWTPTSRASGFVVDATGLVLTNQHVIGSAATAEVQLTPSVKVAARVLMADRTRDVAVLWIDSSLVASIGAVPLDCATPSRTPLTDGQKIVTLGAPLRGQKDLSVGEVIRIESQGTVADFRLAAGGIGGPVFDTGGRLVGVSSVVEGGDTRSRRDARVVSIDNACEAIRSAETTRQTASPPAAALLPVEPLRPFPVDALEAAVKSRAGSLNPYQVSSSDFDVAFITPVLVYNAQHNTRNAGGSTMPGRQIDLTDFGEWSDYFLDTPPVLIVRVTPKQTESFWTTFARGAAYTQGVALPPIKHFKPGFLRLRAYCGDAEVTPIHPFLLEQRVSETDAIHEGLYVFDVQALGPQCKPVKFSLYSEKEPDKPDSKTIDPPIIDRIWQDFAPYRALTTTTPP